MEQRNVHSKHCRGALLMERTGVAFLGLKLWSELELELIKILESGKERKQKLHPRKGLKAWDEVTME